MSKQMHGLQATPEIDDRYINTGRVTVWAFASWLKNAPSITASITPGEARDLALDLLSAAKQAEKAAS